MQEEIANYLNMIKKGKLILTNNTEQEWLKHHKKLWIQFQITVRVFVDVNKPINQITTEKFRTII